MSKPMELGVLKPLMEDPTISEIMINGPKQIFIERGGKKNLTDITFNNAEELLRMIEELFFSGGKRISPKDAPYADICLSDGTRVNAILPPLSRFGVTVTIRKFSRDITVLDDLVKIGTISRKAADLLIACIAGRVNIIFSGGTGVGKTTLLQLLSHYFGEEERVVSVEDAPELRLRQKHWISLETRPPDQDGKYRATIRDLITNSLRMAPDRLIVGEVRGEEALDMIHAMATGHSGTLVVIHGNSPKDVIARLETMVLMSGISLPLAEARKMIASTVNLVVHMQRMMDGTRKVTYITELRGMGDEGIVLNDLFAYQLEKTDASGKVVGSLKPSLRFYPLFFQRFERLGISVDKIFSND